ncbi:MAG TPA: hypothetical protein VEA60_10735 [Allosphingosinicella sp.]|nr:hypothetical protein [Allosphingosinicella sp.]
MSAFATDRERLEATGSPAMLAFADDLRNELSSLGHYDLARRRALLLLVAEMAEATFLKPGHALVPIEVLEKLIGEWRSYDGDDRCVWSAAAHDVEEALAAVTKPVLSGAEGPCGEPALSRPKGEG